MNKTKWLNQIDTPIDSILKESDLIKELASKIKKTKFIKFFLNVLPLAIIFTILGIATWLLIWWFLGVDLQEGFSVVLLFSFVGVIPYLIAQSIQRKKFQKQYFELQLFKEAINEINDFKVNVASFGAGSEIINFSPLTYEIYDAGGILHKKSMRFTGTFRGFNFEFLISKFALNDGIKTVGSIIVDTKEKNDLKMTITSNNIKLENRTLLNDYDNEHFNNEFNVYGDPIKTRKILNATEQEKFIQLSKIAKKVQIDIDNNITIIAFPLNQQYLSLNIGLDTKGNFMYNGVVKKFNDDFNIFLNYLSYFTTIRKINN